MMKYLLSTPPDGSIKQVAVIVGAFQGYFLWVHKTCEVNVAKSVVTNKHWMRMLASVVRCALISKL